MAINVKLVDSEGFEWDFLSGLDPAASFGKGLGVFDGQNDVFDSGLVVSVGGNGVDPQTHSLDFGGREINTIPVIVQAGIAATRSILVSDASISPVGFARFLDSFTNTSKTDQTITVTMSSNSGADQATAIQASSSGDTLLTAADVGFVVDDANTTGADTSVGFAYGDGNMLLPSSATITNGDLITVQHTFTLKAGETKSLLSFAVQNNTAASSIADYTKFTRSLNDMRADNYLAGLSEKEISQIQNYAYIGGPFGTGPLGLTHLTDGEGNRWGVNNNRMGVQTLDSDVLRDLNPGAVLLQNLMTNGTMTIAEDGQEATYTGSFLLRDGAYSVMASPEEGFIRVMLRIDYRNPFESGSFGGVYGLQALLASAQTLVADRNVDGSEGNGVLGLGDGGVVIDDSVSGSGGTRPALTLVFGDTSKIDAQADNDTEEQVSLTGNTFSATDGPQMLPNPGDTFGLLYFVAVNDNGLDAIADLDRLIRPDYKALAGLSAFEVSKIRNFNLTESDRLLTTDGNGDDNTLQGDYWGDLMNGGDGDDTLSGLGSDDVLNGNDGNDILLGGISNDRLFGGFGNDRLDGGTGDDLMQGDQGDDTFIVDSAGDRIIDAPGQGTLDWVKTSVSYDLRNAKGGGDPLEIEKLSTSNDKGTSNINLTGNEFAQTIIGNDGKNTIDGRGGGDRLEGRGGDDTYFVHDANDVVIEAVGGDDDVVAVAVGASITAYALAAGQEIELLQVHAFGENIAMDLTGNEFSQRLYGSEGKNVLDGGGGGDVLEGNGGDDTYIVNSINDVIVETSTGGANDTVLTKVTFDLLEGVYIETFSAFDAKSIGAINLYGNTLAQQITGNAGANIISDGGKGAADVLKGLGGDDTYRVYNSGDTIVEGVDEGANDTVLTNVSFDLLEGVYIETFGALNQKSTASLNLYGNTLAQEITGNAGKNIISDGGKGAADVLKGLAGNDTYRVYNAGTVVVEGAGQGLKDTVQAAVSYTLKAGVEVEVLTTTSASGKGALSLYGNEFGQTITGNKGANALRGYDGDDTINGGDGADKISGGLGNDTLAGNAGADTYYFSYALDEMTNVDTIKGFSGIDLISLSSSIFSKAGPAGNLAASAFVANVDGKAADASDRIIYETDTGILRYDPDGTGAAAAITFAIMDGLPSMNAGDFVIA
ncbi:MAG: hypothetical protein KF914_09935 [Rhizobiaceae bacterium]|nr:hypothetical protein [Rhizobiaceae bacterium]